MYERNYIPYNPSITYQITQFNPGKGISYKENLDPNSYEKGSVDFSRDYFSKE